MPISRWRWPATRGRTPDSPPSRLRLSCRSRVEQEAIGRLATVRLTRSDVPPAPVVDLLSSSGIEPEVVAEAEPLDLLPNLRMGIARTGHLIALKVLSRDDVTRPQDLVDLRALLRVATPGELARARRALTLIAARGYRRGRDLMAEMDTLAGS